MKISKQFVWWCLSVVLLLDLIFAVGKSHFFLAGLFLVSCTFSFSQYLKYKKKGE
jgi:hypothetical protein